MNDTAVYHTQWVKAGGNAAAPSGTPARTATAQYNYTFIGWSRNQNSTAADSTALQTVAAPRTLYAAYTATVRTYTVRFYNGSTLLQTVTGVKYGGSAAYTGSTPVSPDGSAEDYPFEGWNPPPTNIQGNTDCKAVFGSPLEVKEIEDSWDEILAACADGSYATRYKLGNYKPLDMGDEGVINMQIVGKDVDALADGSGMAPLSWIGIELLKTEHRMNPELETVYKYEIGPSWVQDSTTTYNWTSKNRYVANSVAKMSLKITAVTDGTIKLGYNAGISSTTYVGLALKVNGETVVSSPVSSLTRYKLAVTSGSTYTVEIEHTNKFASGYYTGIFRIDDEANRNEVSALNSLIKVSDITIEDCTGGSIDYYAEGTGTIGGWEKSEMRTYLKETVKPLVPDNVRNGIKIVLKNQPACNATGSSFTQTTEDDLWLPSKTEIAETLGNINQPRYKAVFPDNASRIKKKTGAGRTLSWWLRSASFQLNNNYFVSGNGGAGYIISVSTIYGVPLCFCT